MTLEPVKLADGDIDWDATRTKLEEAYSAFPLDLETGAPAWKAAYSTLFAQEQERAILSRMAEIDGKIPEIPGLHVGDWTHRSRGDDALMIDAELARSTPCTRVNLGATNGFMVFSKGFVGALSDGQINEYCLLGFDDKDASPTQTERLLAHADAATSCALVGGGSLDIFSTCLGKELKKRGVEP